MMNDVKLLGEWGYGEYDAGIDDAAEAAWQRQQELSAKGWTELVITDELDTVFSGTFRLRGIAPNWAEVSDGETADGMTVHAVFARDNAAVAAKLLELSAGHADNGRRSEYPELPGWKFSEHLNGVTAQYRDDEFPPKGGQPFRVPAMQWNDPAWGGDGKVTYSAYWRFEQGACPYCGGEWAYGTCQRCGAY
jgi:hypothetical protein